MIKVLWISNIPSPYKIELMNLLAKEVNLTCLFESEKEKDRNDKWYGNDYRNFKWDFLGNNWFSKIISLFNSDYDILINSDYSKPQCILATLLFRMKGKPVILQADGGIAVDRGFVVNNLISIVMKLSNYYLSSGFETDKYFNFYKISDHIYHYRFSSINNKDIIINNDLISKKDELKNLYNLNNKTIFVSVGQPIYRKGFDILINAYAKIENDNTVLLIVGGKAQEENKKLAKQLNIKNIYFIDFLEKDKLSKVYAMSDCFFLATREDIWGLVINEAMSFGLPIISTEKCVAAVEFNRIAKNAIIVPINNIEKLAEAMKSIINNKELANELSLNSLNTIKEYTIENTAIDYYDAIKKILNKEE